ncbi:DUF6435 family protein [Amphritea sp.]|uniref:DUF6435 family protein n=1 Tax=Amphritea sp. TaxID=1872502 RepID=UPI003A944D01
MFSIFKSNPSKKLDKQYKSTLEEAMQAQRNGNIERYSELSVEADKLYQQILAMEKKT